MHEIGNPAPSFRLHEAEGQFNLRKVFLPHSFCRFFPPAADWNNFAGCARISVSARKKPPVRDERLPGSNIKRFRGRRPAGFDTLRLARRRAAHGAGHDALLHIGLQDAEGSLVPLQ